jgi:hypothetical protein
METQNAVFFGWAVFMFGFGILQASRPKEKNSYMWALADFFCAAVTFVFGMII